MSTSDHTPRLSDLEKAEAAIKEHPELSKLVAHFILNGMVATLTPLEEFHHRALALEAERSSLLKRIAKWISVEEKLPKPGVYVLAFVVDPARPNWSRRIRAQYAGVNTLELDMEQDPWPGCTYDEASDTNYVKPGWYETNEYEETNWRVADTITHWMELPAPPALHPTEGEQPSK